MKDIVLVPCYERNEYTRLCLEYLSRARGIEYNLVVLCVDAHDGDGGINAGQMHNLQYGNDLFEDFLVHIHAPHNTYGNSKNIVDSLKMAYDAGAQRIFLVEDDIMVAPDIFEWHEAVLEQADPFVSCATALNKSAHFQINGPQAMDERCQDTAAYKRLLGPYSSHAAAFKRENLGLLLTMIEKYPVEWAQGYEQDIYIQRLMGSLSFPNRGSAWPYVPRAYNVGWRSYHINTGMQFNGTLEEKVRALEATIKDPVRLRDMSANNAAVTPLPETWPVRTEPVHPR